MLPRTIIEETLCQIDMRICSEEVGEEQVYIYMIFWAGRIWEVHIVNHKAITVNHTEQISQVNDFSVFPCMRRCKNLGSLKFAPRYASSLWVPLSKNTECILSFFILMSPQGVLALGD